MRTLTKEEMQRLYDELVNQMDSMIFQSFTTSTNPYPGISPTDLDAKGMYPYQEPEQDEQGTFYGYKILHKHCGKADCEFLVSPRFPGLWEDGELTADHIPSEHTMFGIHFTKRPNHPELNQYFSSFHGAAYSSEWKKIGRSVLVKCALSGTIVETEQGFRAEHAYIIGVFTDGHWQSYQDYQERARAYSRPNPIYTWEEWNAAKKELGDWKTYTDFNSDP